MASFEELYNIISSYEKIAIVGHCLPDGDCYGCQIGLREALRLAFPSKQIKAIGTGLGKLIPTLSPMDTAEDDFFDGALAILVDVSCVRRVEEQRILSCAYYIKFDHHDPNRIGEAFPYPAYADQYKIACCQIVTEFIEEMHLPLNKLGASALYAGIVTDSGRFRFYGTDRHTFDAVKYLMGYGLDYVGIFEALFHEEPNEKAYKQWMRDHATLHGNVALIEAKKEDYESFGLAYEKASDWVNAIAGCHKAPIYMYVCERDAHYTRIELRSNKLYPVQPTCMAFGGGGHRYAAGLEIVDDTLSVQEILDVLNKVVPDEKRGPHGADGH